MKKIFTILLAVCALSIVMGGCSKSEEPAAGDAAKPAGDAAKPAEGGK